MTKEENLNRQKLDTAILQIEKKYGLGTVQEGKEIKVKTPIISSTGSYTLDLALGCMGIPEGRIIELYGTPSGGKTTIAIHLMREVQKVGKKVVFVDLENSFDPEWAHNIGIDLDNLIIIQPSLGDEAFDIIEMLAVTDEIGLIVVDSVSAMTTRAELEGEYGDAHIGQLARLMSQGLKKLNAAISHKKCTVAFINQIRMAIGKYGNPEVTSGGVSLSFYASIRLEVRRKEVLGSKEDPDGFVTKIKVAKNKCGPPFRIAEVDLYIGKEGRFGIDNYSEIINLAISNEIIKRTGAWFKYTIKGNEERWQGKNKLIDFLKENENIFEEIKNQVFTTVLNKTTPIQGSMQDIINQKTNEDKVQPERKAKKDNNIQEEETNISE